jgi:hypothetical protein
MVKNGGKVKWERLCRFLAVYLGVFKTLSQDTTPHNANVTYHFWKPGHVLSQEKNPAWPRLAQLRKLHLKLNNFFQPASFFTEMLGFDKNNQRNFSELLSIKSREILDKSRKNKIFIISGFNGGHSNSKKSPG